MERPHLFIAGSTTPSMLGLRKYTPMWFQPVFIPAAAITTLFCHRVSICSPLAFCTPLSVSFRSTTRAKHWMSFPSPSTPSETTSLLRTDSSSAGDEPFSGRETWSFARPYVIPATSKLRILAVFSLVFEFDWRAVIVVGERAFALPDLRDPATPSRERTDSKPRLSSDE